MTDATGDDRSGSTFDVLCAGVIVADHVCRPIPAFPPPGTLILTDGMELTIGGCAANVAVNFAKLGRPVAVCGCVGTDVFGRYVDEILRGSGVCCDFLETAQTETACTVVVNIVAEDRRFIHTLGANAKFTGENITPELIGRSRVVYVGGYGLVDSLSPSRVRRLFEEARARRVLTVLDVVLPKPRDYGEWIAPLLPLVDLFLPNTDEARLLLGEADPVRQAERFHSDGAATTVVTCGPDGAVIVGDDCRLRADALSVPCVDGTGSGDAFLTGVLHARLDGENWETALQYGGVLGACCVQHPGATAGTPDAETLRRLVASGPPNVAPLANP
jgi:sugar/nucleoside kinase (ribokinase family)